MAAVAFGGEGLRSLTSGCGIPRAYRNDFRRVIHLVWLASAAFSLAVTAAVAQTPLRSNPVPQGSPLERILPVKPPAVSPGVEIVPSRPASLADPNATVTINAVSIEGTTL